jgi:prophage regulatory protein
MSSKKMLVLRQVLGRVPVSKSTLLRQVAKGAFPRPIQIGENRVAWLEDEIDAHLEKLVAARDEANQTADLAS